MATAVSSPTHPELAVAPLTSSSQCPLPSTLASHGLRCDDQTPDSVRRLLSAGQLNPKHFIEKSPDIERTLMEAFVEDDYDGTLHLSTLSIMMASADDCAEEEVVGLAFWREVPEDEMGEWMDMKRISDAISSRTLDCNERDDGLEGEGRERHHDDLPRDARRSMRRVRNDSVGWIRSACESNRTATTSSHHSNSIAGTIAPESAMMKRLTHSWIKIELLAIKRTHRARHLGSILLGCTLSKAHALHRTNQGGGAAEHAILHVAGGGATKNVPADRLYRRYGFVSVPEHASGGPFVKPDRDLFVLGNIGRALDALPPWDEMMQLTSFGSGGGASVEGQLK